jgi:hypothetical protein
MFNMVPYHFSYPENLFRPKGSVYIYLRKVMHLYPSKSGLAMIASDRDLLADQMSVSPNIVIRCC